MIVQEGGTGLFSPEAGDAHFSVLYKNFDKHAQSLQSRYQQVGGCRWVDYRPGDGAANVIICEGGNADGNCFCYTGLTGAGRMAVFVVEFVPYYW